MKGDFEIGRLTDIKDFTVFTSVFTSFQLVAAVRSNFFDGRSRLGIDVASTWPNIVQRCTHAVRTH